MKEREIKLLEKYLKAVANDTRLRVLFILDKDPGLSLNSVARETKSNLKTVSEHLRKLAASGIIDKKNNGRVVNHYLTEEGKKMVKIIKQYFN